MYIDFLRSVFARHAEREALVWKDRKLDYGTLDGRLDYWTQRLDDGRVEPGTVVSLEADFSPNSIALMLTLIERACIIVPLTSSVDAKKPEFRQTAEVETVIAIDADDEDTIEHCDRQARQALLTRLKDRRHPGLVLFSSGSTGKSKGAVQDFAPMLEKFKVPRHQLRAITFLLFDHIGGVNTLLYSLSNGGCIVTVQERTPEAICKAVQDHRVELLPTSPTFLNLLLISEAYRKFDLSSLQTITYGTEVMPASILERMHAVFPDIRLLQTYGLSEVGILRSKSRSSDSLWVKVGGEGFETRVVDGMLEIKAESAMLGYLNAPSPFTEDGWFITGDAVEVDGDYLRILGRKSELINVGGEKVYPAEVESVLQTMAGVGDAAVSGEKHAITGHIVVARVQLTTDEALPDFKKRMRRFCADKLARYMIPQKVELVEQAMHGERFKKMR